MRALVALAAAAAAASRSKDPRNREACAIYGARGAYSVVTTEDRIAGRGPGAPRPAYDCTLKAPYGRFADAAGGGPPIFFLEIPKAGSTTVKAWLRQESATNKRNARFDVRKSFTVVREPLARFLSGYGTVRHRGAHHWPFNTTLPESDKFERFVDLLSAEGDGLALHRPKERCLWYHAFSQLFFFEFLPGKKVDDVLHLETLETDLARMLAATPLAADNRTLAPALPPRMNAREGNFDTSTLRASSPDGIRKALRYLQQDYACLGYAEPRAPEF